MTQQSSATVAAGSVISQSPGGGASVATGSAVNLVVSTGPAADTQAPSAPAGLTAQLVNSRPQLSWQPATDNVVVVGYIVYRSTLGGFFSSEVARTSATSWTDMSSLVVGRRYTYSVRAYDAAGNVGGRSGYASVTR